MRLKVLFFISVANALAARIGPTVWAEWLAAQQDVYLKIIDIVQSHGADFAFPSQTLYMDNITPPEQGR